MELAKKSIFLTGVRLDNLMPCNIRDKNSCERSYINSTWEQLPLNMASKQHWERERPEGVLPAGINKLKRRLCRS